MRDYPYISGQILFNNSLENLEIIFKDSILKHEIRHSSHFQNGTYLRLSLNTDAELTFENISANEFLIRGEANSQNDLLKLADITSSVFSKQNLRHRLELYDIYNNEFGYFNYEWIK
jgi:hypothetical protein